MQNYEFFLKSGKPSGYRERSLRSPQFGFYPYFSIGALRHHFADPRLAFWGIVPAMTFWNRSIQEKLPSFEVCTAFTVNSATIFRVDIDIVSPLMMVSQAHLSRAVTSSRGGK